MGKKSFVAKVKECYTISGICKLFLNLGKGNSMKVEPGQFVVIEPLYECSVMPRPFSVVAVTENIIEVIIKVVGPNTRAYSEIIPGHKLKITGPHGRAIEIEEMAKNIVLLGGGAGSATLPLLAKKLKKHGKNVIVYLGAKNIAELIGAEHYYHEKIPFHTITEEDDCGDSGRGYVTDLLEDMMIMNPNVTVIACGPYPMLDTAAQICKKHGKKCFVILEEIMACGVGSCKGCALFDVDGNVRHVCSDGPTFDAEIIDWEKNRPDQNVKIVELESLGDDVLQTTLQGKEGKELNLEFPFLNASGCLGIEALEEGFIDYGKFGALVTKGVTVMPRAGNPMPRTCETPTGMINSIGLENLGIKKFIDEELPRWLVFGRPVIVNISGYSVEEYIDLAREVSKTDVAGIEVNISCPNIVGGGMSFGTNLDLAKIITREVLKVASDKFIIVKLTPNVTDVIAIAKAVVDGGADALSLINTVQGMAIDVETRKPKIATVYGGLSGPAIRPIAVRMVDQIYSKNFGVPIIGMGGIEDGPSSAELFMAGASAVGVGTGIFSNWQIFDDMFSFVKNSMLKHGFSSVEEYVGSVIK